MKQINSYIKESSSLYDSGSYSGRNSIPLNYIEHNDGDTTFGELKKGDTLYIYSYSHDEIVDVTVNGTLTTGKDFISIKTKSFKLNSKGKPQSAIQFGPTGGGRSGRVGDDEHVVDYSPNNVEKSSICISFGGGYAVGTNKETVLKYAKSDITSSINKIQSDIDKLQSKIESLKQKLENIK